MISAQGREHIVGSLRGLLADLRRLFFCEAFEFEDRDLFVPLEDDRRDLLLDVRDLLARDGLVALL